MSMGVLILSYGGSNVHAPLVAELYAQDVDKGDILVVHNPDGSYEGALPVPMAGIHTMVMERNVGYGAAMNAGIRECLAREFDWILLLTQDARPSPGAISQLLATAERSPAYGVLGPTLRDSHANAVFSYGGFDDAENITTHRVERPTPGSTGTAACDWVDGSAMLVRARAYNEAGPLDEGFFMYFEEADFCLRVRAAGWRVGAVVEAEFATAPGQAKRPLAFGYLFSRNGLWYARRAGGRRGVLAAIKSQVKMSWWLAPKPYNRRFYDRAERRFGYTKAAGLWLGMIAAALHRPGPPPPYISRLSDISGTRV